MIAPAPIKPMPVTTPCRIFALLGTLSPITEIAVCTRPIGWHRAREQQSAACAPFHWLRWPLAARRGRMSPPDGKDGRDCRPTGRKRLPSDIPECRKHTGAQVVEQMTVEGP